MKYEIIFKSGKIKNVVSKDANKIKNYITESFDNIKSYKRLDERVGDAITVGDLKNYISSREFNKICYWRYDIYEGEPYIEAGVPYINDGKVYVMQDIQISPDFKGFSADDRFASPRGFYGCWKDDLLTLQDILQLYENSPNNKKIMIYDARTGKPHSIKWNDKGDVVGKNVLYVCFTDDWNDGDGY